jgi:NADH-quinone oxidoreductase subunit N
MKGLFIISGLGIFAMLAEIFKGYGLKKLLYPVVLLGIIAAFVVNLTTEWNNNMSINLFNNMIVFDNFALAFSGVILAVAFFWFIFANDYFENNHNITDHFALILFALTGALMLTAYKNMTTLFLGIEIMSIPLYVLAASKKNDVSSNEAGFKYLILGSFATGFLLFGIALVYGATGTFDIMAIRAKISAAQGAMPMFFYVGVMMMLVAMSFKVSAAPFHFWAPDVYQGSPTVITAFMSTIVKTAAFAAFIRLFLVSFGGIDERWNMVMAVIIALSLVVSNITAASQNNLKRMLAYSSISHAAFMLMAILAVQPGMSIPSILYYTLAYSVGSITAFAVIYNVAKKSTENIEAFNGLGKRNPLLAFCMLIAMLSLAGIPVTAGFFAKYYIFTTIMATSFKWLLVIAVLTSAVGAYYYFKIIIAMYFKKPDTTEPVEVEMPVMFVLIITTLLTLAIGVVPGYIIGML